MTTSDKFIVTDDFIRDVREENERQRQDYMKKAGVAAIGGQGAITGIGSVFVPNTAWNDFQAQTTPCYPLTINPMIYHASVEKAENGYILKVVHKQGEQPKQYVASTTEELQKVFIAAIVAERISK